MNLRFFRTLLVLMFVITLFATSFHEPAIFFRQTSTGPHGVRFPAGYVVKTGKQLALASLLGPFFGNFAVFANPLLIAGCILILLQKTRMAVNCLAWAVACALQTFQLMLLPYHEDEGGVSLSYMVHPLIGWYCWFGAILLALLLSLEQNWTERHRLSS